MKTHFTFIGRQKELQQLRDFIEVARPTLGVVYGRRRIGKSELIKKAFKGKKILIFEGLENHGKAAQLENFLFQLAYQTKARPSSPIKSWSEAFLFLYETLKKDPHDLVFDEFQWMANYRSEIVSELKPVWDQYFTQLGGVSLVLCGSIASFMITKVLKSTAFYGRIDLEIHLKPFHIHEVKQMLGERGSLEIMEAYFFSGGVPQYLTLLKEMPSVRIGLEELAFQKTGPFFSEYDKIFVSHFGKNPAYDKIIKVLAKYPYGLFREKIASETGVTLGGVFSNYLENLEAAGFIMRQTPFHKESHSRLVKYFLFDAYLRFYFSFLYPNLRKIDSGIKKDIFKTITQSGAFYSWLGRSFEYFCLAHAEKITQTLGFSGIDFTFGPYFKHPKKKRTGIQIDLLFDRADHVLTLCEMKYSLNPVGKSVIQEVEAKVCFLRERFPKKTIQKILVSANGVTEEVKHSGYFFKTMTVKDFLS